MDTEMLLLFSASKSVGLAIGWIIRQTARKMVTQVQTSETLVSSHKPNGVTTQKIVKWEITYNKTSELLFIDGMAGGIGLKCSPMAVP
jgi:hypothetical protein